MSTAQAPLAAIATVTSHSRPRLSPTSPPHTQPGPPIAIAANVTAEATVSRDIPLGAPDTATLAATKAGIQVHALYSSNMCPRYPAVARRQRLSRTTTATSLQENGRFGKGYGPSRYAVATSAAASNAAALDVRTTGVTPTPGSAWTKYGPAFPTVRAPTIVPTARPRRAWNHV